MKRDKFLLSGYKRHVPKELAACILSICVEAFLPREIWLWIAKAGTAINRASALLKRPPHCAHMSPHIIIRSTYTSYTYHEEMISVSVALEKAKRRSAGAFFLSGYLSLRFISPII